jgi:acetyltransferase-like isoleucine patch superfamily enzyme
MFDKIKNKFKSNLNVRFLWVTFRHPLIGILGFIYGAYLTIRFVDTYKKFPAIIFQDRLICVRIRKKKESTLVIDNRLIVRPLGVTRTPCLIKMEKKSTINIKAEFVIGDNVQLVESESALIQIGGRFKESASGISGSCLISAYDKIIIGEDVIIAWDTYITDSDWHSIGVSPHNKATLIGQHVWIAVGCKILKGANIGNNSIVGCSAVVIEGDYPPQSLLVGIPARVSRRDIPQWSRDLQQNHLFRGNTLSE